MRGNSTRGKISCLYEDEPFEPCLAHHSASRFLYAESFKSTGTASVSEEEDKEMEKEGILRIFSSMSGQTMR